MNFNEFASMTEENRKQLTDKLTDEQVLSFCDAMEYDVPADYPRQKGHIYFDDIEGLKDYLRRHVVPPGKPHRVDEVANHEMAHAKAALSMGVVEYVLHI